MPKLKRPPTSGYAKLAQADDEDDEYLNDSDKDDATRPVRTISSHQTASSSSNNVRLQISKRPDRMHFPNHFNQSDSSPTSSRKRENSGVDLKALNARFERWAEEIATKFKLKKGSSHTNLDHLEIQHSVFQAPDWIRPATVHTSYHDPPGLRMMDDEYDQLVESVRIAIEMDVHPTLIAKGSSGSYFVRSPRNKIVGVFKPKDEEPYASKNPKWTKWLHRNLFPCFFGRACLIPNLSYVSEAAAYVLDRQLRCNLVPYTDVVALSSKSFHYDYWDRRSFNKKNKALPDKLGSLQVFLNGYQDATTFFKENPWPDQNSDALENCNTRKPKKVSWTDDCRRSRNHEEDDDQDSEPQTVAESDRRRKFWSEGLQRNFRLELEKLVILDYIMRNTDRGLDNWMIRIDDAAVETHSSNYSNNPELPYKSVDSMDLSSGAGLIQNEQPAPTVRIGAIDNSLSFPWKHPDEWRSYPYGWLFLPVSLIGHPFSEVTRRHFLLLLTSKAWWSETQAALRASFKQDADFKENMFAKQMAIIKGQAWNVVETLKCPDHGPLELTRRARVCVWDEIVEVPIAVPLTHQSPTSYQLSPADDDGDIATATHPLNSRYHNLYDDLPPSYPSSSTGTTAASLLQATLNASHPEADNPFNSSRQYYSPSEDNRYHHTAIDDGFEPPLPTLSPPNALAMSASVHSAGGHPAPRTARGHTTHTDRYHRSRRSFDGFSRLLHQQHASSKTKKNGKSGSGSGSGNGSNKRKPHARRLSTSNRFGHWDEVDEADLGYAANEDRDCVNTKVIVERLENVKSKNPVFTWC